MKQDLFLSASPQSTGELKSNAELSLHLLGRPRICVDGVDVTKRLKYRKGLALLGYLASHGGRWVLREQVAGMIWPDLERTAALTNLRQVLNNLREVVNAGAPTEIIQSDRVWIGFFPASNTWMDMAWLVGTPVKGFAPSLEQLGDRFLDGIEVPDSEEFEDWLGITRQHLRNRYVARMEERCQMQRGMGQRSEAVETARQLVENDPLDESAMTQLMNLLQESGSIGAAMNAFDSFKTRLDRELNQTPGETLRFLREKLASIQAMHPAGGSQELA